jgi:hypothetical protein
MNPSCRSYVLGIRASWDQFVLDSPLGGNRIRTSVPPFAEWSSPSEMLVPHLPYEHAEIGFARPALCCHEKALLRRSKRERIAITDQVRAERQDHCGWETSSQLVRRGALAKQRDDPSGFIGRE